MKSLTRSIQGGEDFVDHYRADGVHFCGPRQGNSPCWFDCLSNPPGDTLSPR